MFEHPFHWISIPKSLRLIWFMHYFHRWVKKWRCELSLNIFLKTHNNYFHSQEEEEEEEEEDWEKENLLLSRLGLPTFNVFIYVCIARPDPLVASAVVWLLIWLTAVCHVMSVESIKYVSKVSLFNEFARIHNIWTEWYHFRQTLHFLGLFVDHWLDQELGR